MKIKEVPTHVLVAKITKRSKLFRWKGGINMYSFEQIEEAKSLIAKEYSFIGSLTKNYRINVNDLIPYTESLDRIRKLNTIIHS